MTRKNPHGLDNLTPVMIEGAAQELHYLASRGQSWQAAGHEVREELRGVVKRVLGAGQAAELVARSKRSTLP